MTLSVDQLDKFDQFCKKVIKIEGVRYIGIINIMGRTVTEKVKADFKYLIPDEKIRMAHIQLSLDLAMRKEFTEYLGSVDKIIAYRDKVNIATFPLASYFAMLSIERNVDVEKTINQVSNLAKEFKISTL